MGKILAFVAKVKSTSENQIALPEINVLQYIYFTKYLILLASDNIIIIIFNITSILSPNSVLKPSLLLFLRS